MAMSVKSTTASRSPTSAAQRPGRELAVARPQRQKRNEPQHDDGNRQRIHHRV